MSYHNIFKISDNFIIQIKKAQENQELEINLSQVYAKLTAVVQGFLNRNSIKLTLTQKPFIKPPEGEKNGAVAAGFMITKEDMDSYLTELNNEIQKLQQEYPNIIFRAYYDNKNTSRAQL